MFGGSTSIASDIGSTTVCGKTDLKCFRFGRQFVGTDLLSSRLTPNSKLAH